MRTGTMTVLADDTVEGHRVVTYHNEYGDKILAATPYRTEVVEPGKMLPSCGMDHPSQEAAMKAHREKIDKLRRR